MKFKEWLEKLEESQRYNPQAGNFDRTTGLGPTSHFGGPRALLPISYGFDNRAFAGVVDAVGNARAKIRARKGAEPGVASQYGSLEDMRRDAIQTVTMPLQLPEEWSAEDGDIIYVSKGLVAQIKSSFRDPLESTSLYRVDDQMNIQAPSGNRATRLYMMDKNDEENPSELESAINYTTALMQASLQIKLSKYSHLLNLDRPTIKDRKIMPFPYGKQESKFFKAMMCAFSFSPKSKDADIGDDIHSQIDRAMKRGDRAAPTPSASPAPAPAPAPNPKPAPPTIPMSGGGK